MEKVYPEQMKIEYESKEKAIISMYDGKENKKSVMIIYHIFNGLDLIHNKFNTYNAPESNQKLEKEYIEINYCKRGVFECTSKSGRTLYLSEGEIASNINMMQKTTSNFVNGYYEGIEILIDIEEFQNNLPEMFKNIIDNIKELKEVLINNELGVILKPIKEMIHIFDELYYIDPEKDKLYAQIKALELLHVFTAIPFDTEARKKVYLGKKQIDKIKMIHEELINNLDKKITIEQLSEKYQIGTTPLKMYFKEIYGQPIYTYLKDYKIHVSLHLLEETDKNINEIEGMLGYDNSSKFASVFKAKMKCPPTEYRKQKVHLEHERLFGVEI
ncbi:MAG TPA: AraC family transcriptional regulator [Clostridiaceae bacterium]|nr:AraC family transcriptional regulator [Clostridiaceae bacterium]